MNIGLALVPAIEKEVEELERVCGTQGIRKAVPLIRDDMVEKLTTAEALNQVASAQETVVTSWKDLDGNIHMKRNRLRMLTDHWKSMLRTIDELRKQCFFCVVSRATAIQIGSVVLLASAKKLATVQLLRDYCSDSTSRSLDAVPKLKNWSEEMSAFYTSEVERTALGFCAASAEKSAKKVFDLYKDSERIVRYVIAHQMQTRASIVPDGKVILDVGANIFVDFSYDEAEQRIRNTLKLVEECSRRLVTCLEECKQNIVTSEVNLSQLHNYSVEIRDLLLQKAGS